MKFSLIQYMKEEVMISNKVQSQLIFPLQEHVDASKKKSSRFKSFCLHDYGHAKPAQVHVTP